MANYIVRKHTIDTADSDVFHPADKMMTGTELNGMVVTERLNVMLADANGQRTGAEINFEPGETVADLSEVGD